MIEALRRLPGFSSLPEGRLEALAAIARRVDFPAGSVVATPGSSLLVVLEGSVSTFIMDAADRKFLLGVSGEGDLLGELSFLTADGGNDQKVELEASGNVRCLSFPAREFFGIIGDNPDANLHLGRVFARRLAAMNAFAKQVVDIDIDPTMLPGRTPGERTADWLSEWIGSWYFLAAGFLFVLLWIGVNLLGFFGSFDPYPFIFLNLVFSIISGATMPVLLISQNRQNQMDRMAARVNHRFTMRSNQMLESLIKKIDEREGRSLRG